MAGVYIKAMQAPVIEQEWRIIRGAAGEYVYDGNAETSDGELHEVIPTPDHGRLVDADELYRRIKTECNPYGSPTISYDDGVKVLDIISAMPTVIPADKEKKNDP